MNREYFFKIIEKLEIKSIGQVVYGDTENPTWYDLMKTGQYCKQYRLFEDCLWCYNSAIEETNNLENITQKNKMGSATYSAMSNCYLEMNQYSKAVEINKKAIEINPENYEAFLNNGIALTNLKLYDEAIDNYKKSIQLNPNLSNSWNAMGWLLVDFKKDYKNAITYLDKAIELDKGENPNAWINKGNALSALKQFDLAYYCWDTAFALNPQNNVHAMLNKAGNMHFYQNKKDDALNLLNKVALQVGENNKFHSQILNLYEQILNDNR